jgi:hypothetical protein
MVSCIEVDDDVVMFALVADVSVREYLPVNSGFLFEDDDVVVVVVVAAAVVVGAFILVIPTTKASDIIEWAHCVNIAFRFPTTSFRSKRNNDTFGSIINVSMIRMIIVELASDVVVVVVVVTAEVPTVSDVTPAAFAVADDDFGGYETSIRIGYNSIIVKCGNNKIRSVTCNVKDTARQQQQQSNTKIVSRFLKGVFVI